MSPPSVRVTLRIPVALSDPTQLMNGLPDGFEIDEQWLITPDDDKFEISPLPPDDQFANVFTTSCRQPATPDETSVVQNYQANICLCGPGGSLESALRMMKAGVAIIEAGGAGVFIDNSGLAHGGSLWRQMADDGGPDALSYGFVSIVEGKQHVWTMGMHVLGLPEVLLRRQDNSDGNNSDGNNIVEIIRYMASSNKPIEDGHILIDENGPTFRAVATDADERITPDSAMYNPWGRLKMVSMNEIAESN